MAFGDSNLTLQVSNGAPVLTAGCCGNIVIQHVLRRRLADVEPTNASDDAAGNTDSAIDAKTGAVVASWNSNAGSGGIWRPQKDADCRRRREGADPVPARHGRAAHPRGPRCRARASRGLRGDPPRPAASLLRRRIGGGRIGQRAACSGEQRRHQPRRRPALGWSGRARSMATGSPRSPVPTRRSRHLSLVTGRFTWADLFTLSSLFSCRWATGAARPADERDPRRQDRAAGGGDLLRAAAARALRDHRSVKRRGREVQAHGQGDRRGRCGQLGNGIRQGSEQGDRRDRRRPSSRSADQRGDPDVTRHHHPSRLSQPRRRASSSETCPALALHLQ